MHPAARILLYLISALALPGLSFFGLSLLAMITFLALRGRLVPALRLSWKARWLFLILLLGYAYNLPGQALAPGLGALSPSLPGIRAGVLQMFRLLLLLWLLHGLVISLGNARLISGLYVIFNGFGPLGFPAERAAVRVGLTLQAMEEARLAAPKTLRDALCLPQGPDLGGATVLPVQRMPWRWRDTLMLVAATLSSVGLWFA